MGGIFGGGGSSSRPAPPPPAPAPVVSNDTSAEKARQRRIGRAALVKSTQEGILNPALGRNVLTAVG
jgi:hypothetical protein